MFFSRSFDRQGEQSHRELYGKIVSGQCDLYAAASVQVSPSSKTLIFQMIVNNREKPTSKSLFAFVVDCYLEVCVN